MRDLDRLQRAFAASPGTDPGPDCATAQTIWRAAVGELPEAETTRLLDHSLSCGACAQVWQLAGGLASEVLPVSRRGRVLAFVRRRGLPLAAALAAAALFLLVRPPPPEVGYRGQAGVAAAIDSSLPRGAFALEWAPRAEARYTLTVATPDLEVLYTAGGLAQPAHRVPPDALGKVAPGGVVLVWIEALLPDGAREPLPLQRIQVR